MQSREFLGGLIAVGAAQFLWTVLRIGVWLDPAAWTFGTIRGITIAAVLVVAAGTYLFATRPDETRSRTAFFRFLAGTYLGMAATLVLLRPASGLVTAILFGMGLLLPPIAVGTGAGEIIRMFRKPRPRRV